MGRGRIDIGSIRREQVVEAAVAIIAEQGIQNLSLSAIEKRSGMSRGHLTYYFPTKENILLAVFDHMVETMRQRVGVSRSARRASEAAGRGPSVCCTGSCWQRRSTRPSPRCSTPF